MKHVLLAGAVRVQNGTRRSCRLAVRVPPAQLQPDSLVSKSDEDDGPGDDITQQLNVVPPAEPGQGGSSAVQGIQGGSPVHACGRLRDRDSGAAVRPLLDTAGDRQHDGIAVARPRGAGEGSLAPESIPHAEEHGDYAADAMQDGVPHDAGHIERGEEFAHAAPSSIRVHERGGVADQSEDAGAATAGATHPVGQVVVLPTKQLAVSAQVRLVTRSLCLG